MFATPLSLLVLGGKFDFNKIKGFKKQIITGTIGKTILDPLLGVGITIILTKKNIIFFEPAVFAEF